MADSRREPDPLERSADYPLKSLEGDGKLCPTTIFRKLMNFIHNDISYVLQMALHQLPRKDRLERFWRRDEDVRWTRGLLPPLRLGRISMADRCGQLRSRNETMDAVDHVPV